MATKNNKDIKNSSPPPVEVDDDDDDEEAVEDEPKRSQSSSKSTPDPAADTDEARVLDYMRQANRPYSANDVFGNLHKAVGKTAVQRCLDSLVQSGHLCEKTTGKQKVYVANQHLLKGSSQDGGAQMSEAEKRQLEAQVQEAERALSVEQAELKRLQQRLSQATSQLTCEQLRARLAKLQPELEEKEARLAALESGQGRKVTPDQVAEAKKLRVALVTEWRKRKRACLDLTACILEGYPGTKKAFYEEVGLETDEEYKAVMPDI